LFFWPSLKKDITEFVATCMTCQRCKHKQVAYLGLLQPLAIPDHAWEEISMDFVEGLPKSEGRNAILVVVDKLTKFAHFISLTHPFTAQEIARVFIDSVAKLHGLPKSIISDQDKILASHFWQELFKNLGVSLHMSSTYYPESDGQIERVNQCLESYLRCMCFARSKSWGKWLPLAQWWYNTSYHNSIKKTPFEALFGYATPTLLAVIDIHKVRTNAADYLQDR